jgi:hypothetical protein
MLAIMMLSGFAFVPQSLSVLLGCNQFVLLSSVFVVNVLNLERVQEIPVATRILENIVFADHIEQVAPVLFHELP